MAGFRRNIVHVLDFSEYPDLEGFEVRCKPMSMNDKLMTASLFDDVDDASPVTSARALEALFVVMADNILDWNLEDDNGDPVPVTAVEIGDLDSDLQQALLAAWSQRLGGINADLGKDSTSGKPSLEVSLPMELRSPPPGS